MMNTMCWEYLKCGHDKNASCPAFVQKAGRKCWLVAGTLCGGKVQGDNAQKIANCKLCDFYKKIKAAQI